MIPRDLPAILSPRLAVPYQVRRDLRCWQREGRHG